MSEVDPHKYGEHAICDTGKRGKPTPRGQSRSEIVVDASDGFVPLWDQYQTLQWRFNDYSFDRKFDGVAEKEKDNVRELFHDGVRAWGDATPVGFRENATVPDFEIYMMSNDDCNADNACVLASAFFPDGGTHRLVLYPRLFEYSREEQVETMAHELGHVFGLRHFFADVSETAFPSEIFGEHKPFSIMNYGHKSQMTDADRNDLKRLYDAVWSRRIIEVGGTPIVLFRPYHTSVANKLVKLA